MYLRRTQRRTSDGSVVGYIQLANSRWVNGATRAEVLVNLGREDQLDLALLRRLLASIDRYLGDRGTGPGSVHPAAAGLDAADLDADGSESVDHAVREAP